jgi:hypothetical protein
MKFRSALLILPAAAAILFSPSAYSGKSYCCIDQTGRRACGDMLPQECYGRAYREVDSHGNILRQVEAPMTAEQVAQRDADALRKKEEEHAAMEQKRRDMALLNTYASETDIEFMRSRALAEVDKNAKDAQTKLKDALKRKKMLDDELEFYKKKPVPPTLKDQIKSVDADIKSQQIAIDEKTKEKEQLNIRFDEEKKRYLELRHGGKSAVAASAAEPAPPAGARPR